MLSLRHVSHVLIIVALALVVCGCNDDEDCPTCPEDFQITLTAVDADGAPLANVAIGSMPGVPAGVIPFQGPDTPADRSRVTLPYTLDAVYPVKIVIRDIEDSHVATLIDEALDMGQHTIIWNGMYEGTFTTSPSGYYKAVLMIDDDDLPGLTAVDSVGLLHTPFDPGHFCNGVTDAQGRVVLTERRLVPGFWSPPELTHVIEDGTVGDAFALTTETWLFCERPGEAPAYEWGVVNAVDGPQAITVVFEEEPPAAKAPAGRPAPGKRAAADARASFGYPRPNPFN